MDALVEHELHVRAAYQDFLDFVLAVGVAVPHGGGSILGVAGLNLHGSLGCLFAMLDYVLFRDAKRNRILQNLGGIGNLTVIPAGATADKVFAFDTGPANMVIDACMQRLFDKPYDRNGAVAANGWIIRSVVTQLLREPYFNTKPPKSAGREQFGEAYVARLLKLCKANKAQKEDIIATATALTAWSISATYKRFVLPKLVNKPTDFIVSGGGTRNPTLMTMLELSLGSPVLRSDDFGLPSQAKEAAAFALLAWLTWHGEPGNIPSATGAKRAAILGSVSHA